MAQIERATSPLPRECSTTEPHGHRHGFRSCAPKPVSTQPQPSTHPDPAPVERETGIEPVSLAWKAKVLPLNYSRPGARHFTAALMATPPAKCRQTSTHTGCANMQQQSQQLRLWWRRLDSNQRRRKPTDLQSAPFSHSGTPPRRALNYSMALSRHQYPHLCPASTAITSNEHPGQRDQSKSCPVC